MPLQPFKSIPRDIVEWARYFTSLLITPDPGTIDDDTFAARSPSSVIGRAEETAGAPADIEAETDGHVLIRRSGTLLFDALEVADLPNDVATNTNITDAIATHVGLADPHAQYTTAAELSAAVSGFAPLAAANVFTEDQTVRQTENLVVESMVENQSNGTDAGARFVLRSGSKSGAVYMTGAGLTTPIVTGGPTGAQMVIRTLEHSPIVFGIESNYVGEIDADGYFVFPLTDAVDDAAAAIAGVPVDGFYRNGSVVMVRVA